MVFFLTRGLIKLIINKENPWYIRFTFIILILIILPITLNIDILFLIPITLLNLADLTGNFMNKLAFKELKEYYEISDEQIKEIMIKNTLWWGGDYNKINELYDEIYDIGKVTGDRVYKIFKDTRYRGFKLNVIKLIPAWLGHLVDRTHRPVIYKDYKHKRGTRFYIFYKEDSKGNITPAHK